MRAHATVTGLVLTMMFLVGPAERLAAQTPPSTGLAGLLPDLILRDIVLPPPTTGLTHVAHFSPIQAGDLDNPVVAIVESFNKLILKQLSTFPLGTSSGGFTYTFDDSLGTFRRASNSFGPSFAERAVTIGRRKLSTGFTFQHTSYSRFEGENLEDGSIKFYLRHDDCCSPGTGGGGGGGGNTGAGSGVAIPDGSTLTPPFEGDLIEAALSLRVNTDTAAFLANYGLTNRWDVGLAVPIVKVNIDASVLATILRLSTANSPLTHTFEAGNASATQKTFAQSGTATGLGDVVVRSKYHFLKAARGGLAGAVDVRLPTGDQENLLGAGGTQVKMFLVASGGSARVVGHANVGYTAVSGDLGKFGLLASVGGNEPLPNEINYTAGAEVIAHPRLTIVGDIIGRTLRDAGRLEVTTKSHPYQKQPAVQPVPVFQFNELDLSAGHLNLLLGTAGAKYNLVGNLLVTANVLFPLTQAGLRSRVSVATGIDFSF